MQKQTPFTKRLPAAIETSQRLAIEGLAVACELIGFAFSQIRSVIELAQVSGHEMNVSDNERLKLFTASWAIINRVDAIRQLLYYQRKHILFKPSEAQATAVADANKMRAGMDHALGTIQRLRNQKKEFPLFGIIGWAWFGDGDHTIEDDKFQIVGRNATFVSISGTHHKWNIEIDDILNDTVYVPWGNVNLWSFNKRVVIDELAGFAEDLLYYLNDEISAAASEAIAAADVEETRISEPFCFSVRQIYSNPFTGDITPGSKRDRR